jgi:hypothetical protein
MWILHECVVKPTTDPMVFPITGKPYLVEGSSILYVILCETCKRTVRRYVPCPIGSDVVRCALGCHG